MVLTSVSVETVLNTGVDRRGGGEADAVTICVRRRFDEVVVRRGISGVSVAGPSGPFRGMQRAHGIVAAAAALARRPIASRARMTAAAIATRLGVVCAARDAECGGPGAENSTARSTR